MKALLLAAGLGTRLRPLTDHTPKCLMPIKGQPLLDIWLERLSQAGIEPFLINAHYLYEQVESYIQASAYRDVVTLSYEPVLLGTAGTLITNLLFFENEDGLLIHADNYCLEDFKKFVDAHENRPPYCVMTMMTFRTDSPSNCGIVEIDEDGVVIGFHEKVSNPPGNLANGAIYILSGQFFDILRSELMDASDFSTEILCKLLGKIFTFETIEPLVDIGTVEAYSRISGN